LQSDVGRLCKFAKVSKSGYYAWLKHSDELDNDHADYLLIKEKFDKGKKKWGFRTIKMRLEDDKVNMNHKKIIRIMSKYELFCKIRRKNPYKAIMKKSLGHRTFENLLNRQFNQIVPFKVFCTDITYISFNRGFAYLSVIKDIASGEIVAWNLSLYLGMNLVIQIAATLKKL
jgi:transposase InsO family protein